jgi:hypothetical protein
MRYCTVRRNERREYEKKPKRKIEIASVRVVISEIRIGRWGRGGVFGRVVCSAGWWGECSAGCTYLDYCGIHTRGMSGFKYFDGMA